MFRKTLIWSCQELKTLRWEIINSLMIVDEVSLDLLFCSIFYLGFQKFNIVNLTFLPWWDNHKKIFLAFKIYWLSHKKTPGFQLSFHQHMQVFATYNGIQFLKVT